MKRSEKHILWYKEISHNDVPLVGGKNASLGEMISKLSKRGVNIPNGFATTSVAFRYFMGKSGLEEKIGEILKDLDVKNIKNLQERGKKVRNLILKSRVPEDLEKEILKNYHRLSKEYGEKNSDVAVRTSATAEDSPGASFAGQYWTYLNIKGDKELLKAVKGCLASLFTDRAIFYRVQHNFSQLEVALSIGIQKMVRSDLASSGVMFSLDTEFGFKNVVLIDGSYGLGEMIVQGEVTTDEFYVFKPTLKKGYKAIISKTLGSKEQKFVYKKDGGIKRMKVPKEKQNKFCLKDEEVLTLAKWACVIEEHYSKKSGKWTPMDMEWAKDGKTGQLFIVQARPETVHAKDTGKYYQEYKIKTAGKPILRGTAIGSKIAQGKVHKILNASRLKEFKKGEILVTKMTDPDWVPIMKIASAIITDEGSKTCHAAIISRELGIPCIVGTGKATRVLDNAGEITIDCSQGLEGRVFKGKIPFKVKKYNLERVPKLKTKIMVNLGAPEIAFKTSFLPVDGVGLAREEFIIAEKIKIHPLALYHFNKLKDKKLKKKIAQITIEHKKDKKEFFVKELAEGIGQIAAAVYPKPVIVRFSAVKTKEYKQIVGGAVFEPEEDNPMLGWRGASRYYNGKFRPAFEMEIEAIKRARNVFGLKNIWAMIPFCRTIEEGRKVLEIMKKKGMEKGKDGLKVIVMCEIPSNVILIDKFLDIFDGMSIGSNDLTQLTLGLDRDNAKIAYVGNEKNEAIKEQVKKIIRVCLKRKKYVGICGQAPSDYPEFAEFIMKEGIESMSLNADTVIKTILNLAKAK
jgi:pyruvate,water dikinase